MTIPSLFFQIKVEQGTVSRLWLRFEDFKTQKSHNIHMKLYHKISIFLLTSKGFKHNLFHSYIYSLEQRQEQEKVGGNTEWIFDHLAEKHEMLSAVCNQSLGA